MIIYQGNEVSLVTFGDRVIKKIYQGQTLIYQKDLPSGTVLFEKFGTNGGGGFSTYEIILPTSQMVEIVVVGGGSPVVGAVVDL